MLDLGWGYVRWGQDGHLQHQPGDGGGPLCPEGHGAEALGGCVP